MDNDSTKNIDPFKLLTELALDLHWSWSHATDKVWRQLDPVLWELTHNPLVVLQTVSQHRIKQVMEDPIVRDIVDELVQAKRQLMVAPAWFQKAYPTTPLTRVAFFSMEFMLSEALPIYSGGLGNVSGDHLKAASDLGVPVIGVGLLYQRGYSRQIINSDGSQQHVFPYNDPGQLPVTPLRTADGEWLRIEIKFPGYSGWIRTWKVEVGRVMLLLLDTNDIANFPVHRGITGELYGSGADVRLMQEVVLGIGGWRLLKALNIIPEVCHLNEGHSAFVVLERALSFMEENNVSFEVALAATRAGNIFTTHTAVGAGFDNFPAHLIKRYLERYAEERLHITLNDLLALGRKDPHDDTDGFNMSYLAIRGSGYINGVSKLHAKVSRNLFADLFPRWPIDEVPVGHVTNGVHMPTWDSPEADNLWTEVCGKDRWLGTLEKVEENIRSVPLNRIWEVRNIERKAFVGYLRKRFARQLATTGHALMEIEEANQVFDAKVLTLAFARRFVSYKRVNLLLQDHERLYKILSDAEKPVQLVIAGKAHLGDATGQTMIREWIQFINERGLKSKVIFLSDYDMLLTEQMVQGVDVWLNTPRRPWEACGTSGMKVLVNGGLNLSVLDGWWDEAYSPQAGWALGDRQHHDDEPAWDAAEAEQLYSLLENEIIPEFYNRDENDMPVKWVERIRESMAKLTPNFSANRSTRQYTEDYYLPAANAYLKHTANKGEVAKQIVSYKRCLSERWEKVKFGEMTVETVNGYHRFEVQVLLDTFNIDELRVELFAEGINGSEPVKVQMEPATSPFEPSTCIFSTTVQDDRPSSHFTPRIIPNFDDILVPLDCPKILWWS